MVCVCFNKVIWSVEERVKVGSAPSKSGLSKFWKRRLAVVCQRAQFFHRLVAAHDNNADVMAQSSNTSGIQRKGIKRGAWQASRPCSKLTMIPPMMMRGNNQHHLPWCMVLHKYIHSGSIGRYPGLHARLFCSSKKLTGLPTAVFSHKPSHTKPNLTGLMTFALAINQVTSDCSFVIKVLTGWRTGSIRGPAHVACIILAYHWEPGLVLIIDPTVQMGHILHLALFNGLVCGLE